MVAYTHQNSGHSIGGMDGPMYSVIEEEIMEFGSRRCLLNTSTIIH